MDEDVELTCEFSEEELFLITVSLMIDTMVEQLIWLKTVIEEELEKDLPAILAE